MILNHDVRDINLIQNQNLHMLNIFTLYHEKQISYKTIRWFWRADCDYRSERQPDAVHNAFESTNTALTIT